VSRTCVGGVGDGGSVCYHAQAYITSSQSIHVCVCVCTQMLSCLHHIFSIHPCACVHREREREREREALACAARRGRRLGRGRGRAGRLIPDRAGGHSRVSQVHQCLLQVLPFSDGPRTRASASLTHTFARTSKFTHIFGHRACARARARERDTRSRASSCSSCCN